MKTVNLKGQFCIVDKELRCGVKSGVYGSINATRHDNGEWVFEDLGTGKLSAQFGSNNWRRFEIIVTEDESGEWHPVGDYGDNTILQIPNPFYVD